MNFWHTDDGFIHELEDHQIFVFGSNRQGIHGAGAALQAHQEFGAEMGNPEGLQGQSYALPTVDFENEFTKTDLWIAWAKFIICAKENLDYEFWVTAFGTGRAGFSLKEVIGEINLAPEMIPDNVLLPPEWEEHLT